jgi:hypothetical protein
METATLLVWLILTVLAIDLMCFARRRVLTVADLAIAGMDVSG